MRARTDGRSCLVLRRRRSIPRLRVCVSRLGVWLRRVRLLRVPLRGRSRLLRVGRRIARLRVALRGWCAIWGRLPIWLRVGLSIGLQRRALHGRARHLRRAWLIGRHDLARD